MKKFLLSLFVMCSSTTLLAQVGINNTSPQSSLDINAFTDNSTDDLEGLLIPRVSKNKAFLMVGNSPTESTMIYVNDLTDYSGSDAAVEEITANGFYHWNGTKWVASSATEEWVRTTGQRWNYGSGQEVDYDYVYSKFSADNGRELAITSDNNVGIGTNNPLANLHIVGGTGNGSGNSEIRIQRFVQSNSSPNLILGKANGTVSEPAQVTAGNALSRIKSQGFIGTDSNGNQIWDEIASTIETYAASDVVNTDRVPTNMLFKLTEPSNGYRVPMLKLESESGVGIGFGKNDDVKANLHINDAVANDVDLNSTGNPFLIGLESGENLVIDNNEIQSRNNGGRSSLSLQAAGGNVGIGTKNPMANLHIVGGEGIGFPNAEIRIQRFFTQSPPNLIFGKARGTVTNPAPVAEGDALSRIKSQGYFGDDGSGNAVWDEIAATVETYVAATPFISQISSEHKVPTNVLFKVTEPTYGIRVPILKLESESGVGIGFGKSDDVKAHLHVNVNYQANNYEAGLDATNDTPFLIGTTDRDNLVFDTNEIQARNNGAAAALLLQEDGGNVGVGTTSPEEKLHVAGKVKANSYISTVAGANVFPDYVFEKYYNGLSTAKPEYDFKSLNEIESFIKSKGHLPGYISAKDIAEAGEFDIKATQLTNVEKIEELYLHLIEQEASIKAQNKIIKEQSKEIEELKALVLQIIDKQ